MLWVGAVGKADGNVGAGKRSKRSRQIKDRPGEMLDTGAWLEVGRLAGDWGKRRAARVADCLRDRLTYQDDIPLRENEEVLCGVCK